MLPVLDCTKSFWNYNFRAAGTRNLEAVNGDLNSTTILFSSPFIFCALCFPSAAAACEG